MLILLLLACIKPPPPGPAAPRLEAPDIPAAFVGSFDLPDPTIEERFETDMVRPLPLSTRDTVVLVLPDQSVTYNGKACGRTSVGEDGPMSLAPCLLNTRTALLSAFLEEGFRVKDAGTIEVPTMRVRRWPATEKKTEIRREVADDGTETVTETKDRDQHWWWRQEGLLLSLADPTSLWGPELVGYKDLKADAFFRVFSVAITSSSLSAQGLLEFSDEQLADFDRQAAEYNRRLGAWARKREEALDTAKSNAARFDAYRDDFEKWRLFNARSIARHGTKERLIERTHYQVPEIPEPATRDMLRRVVQADSRSVERLQGRMVAELVDSDSGEVLWIGEVSGAVDAGRYARRRLLAGMLRALRQHR